MRYLVIPILILLSFNACQEASVNGKKAMEPQTTQISTADAKRALTPIDSVLYAYYAVKDALVEADSLLADSSVSGLLVLADKLNPTEIVQDSAAASLTSKLIRDIKTAATQMKSAGNLTEKRRAFSAISQHLLPLLNAIEYSGEKVYQQTCPMAFNDTEQAWWLSNAREIMNPYLGKKHPKYAAGMLHCGELTDSLKGLP